MKLDILYFFTQFYSGFLRFYTHIHTFKDRNVVFSTRNPSVFTDILIGSHKYYSVVFQFVPNTGI